MYSVKNKIELFNTMVYEKNKKEKKREIEKLIDNYKDKLAELGKNQEITKDKELEKARKIAEKEKKQLISKARVKAQKKLLEEAGIIMEKFNKYLLENMESFLDSKDYKNYLKREFKELEKELSPDDEIEITIREKDKELINFKNYKLNFSQDILGGFYLKKNDNIKYDYSLKTKIDENSDYIGYLVKETLLGKEGDNFES